MVRNAAASLLTLALVAGCATTPPGPGSMPVWTQLGPDGGVSVRAIVAAGADCPPLELDGKPQSMQLRAPATDMSASTDAAGFPVKACELAVPAATRTLRLHKRPLALPPPTAPARIVVVGDTGCRIKVPANGKADPIQDCADPLAWPWPRLAAAAAATRPDLVIHLGDYHYREFCDDPERCQALRDRGVDIGYGWRPWNADFFAPAAPLLAAAPWVMVRGNHENCDRAGEGWMRFLAPLAYRRCEREANGARATLGNNHTAAAYRIDLDAGVSLIVGDNAGHEDYQPAGARPQDIALFEQTLHAVREAPAGRQLWLLAHRPLWYDLLSPSMPANALQTVLRQGLAPRLQLAFSGHQHTFATLNFAPDPLMANGRPAQVIVGGGGTQLESLDPHSPFYEGDGGPGSKERAAPDARLYDGLAAASGIVLNRYSFLLLERRESGWDGTVIDPDGQPITRCHLRHGEKKFACAFPER